MALAVVLRIWLYRRDWCKMHWLGGGHPLLFERVWMASARFESFKPQPYMALIWAWPSMRELLNC